LRRRVHRALLRIGPVVRGGDPDVLAATITELGRAGDALPVSHPSRAFLIDGQSTALGAWHRLTGDPTVLSAAISAGRFSTTLLPDGPERCLAWHQLAQHLRSRYELTGARTDLDEAIDRSAAARDGLPGDHPGRGAVLAELTWLCWERSANGAGRADLDRAIEAAEEAMAVEPDDSGHLSRLFTVRAARAVAEFDRADAEAVLELGRRTAATAPAVDATRLAAGLARLLYGHTGEPGFLTDAVELGRLAVAAAPGDPGAMVALSEWSRERARVTGSAADIAEAVRLGEQALTRLPPGAPRRAYSLAQLCAAYRERFELLGAIADVHAAVDTGREAVAEAGPDDTGRAAAHSNLGGALLARYDRTGALPDLDEAIARGRSSLAGTTDPGVLGNLANALARRHDRLGAARDLDDAVDAHQASTEDRDEAEEKRAMRLNNLALALATRYDSTGVPDDLDRAVAAAEAARAALPPGDGLRVIVADTLAAGRWRQFRRDGDRRSIDEAVDLAREALAGLAPGDTHRPAVAGNLATYLQARADGAGDAAMRDLGEAVTLLTSELAGLPADHPGRVTLELTRGNALGRRYDLDRSPATVRAALRSWLAVASSPLARPWVRLAAGQLAGGYAGSIGDLDRAVAAYDGAVAQLPLVAWRGIRRGDQEHQLRRWSGLAGDAAFTAARAGRPDRAVELLEHGRGVLWAQLLDSRTDLTRLAAVAPGPAGRLDDVRSALDSIDGSRNALPRSAGGP
jgi:tetratricopeptide (TPR) repeat protein